MNNLESFEKREQEIQVQQLVIEAYFARLFGEEDYSIDESKIIIESMISNKQN